MSKLGLRVDLEAKPGKEQELEDFLKSAAPLADAEPLTQTWFAVKMGPGHFSIFDTFEDEEGRQAHLTGDIAKALFTKGLELVSREPQVEKLEVLAAKIPALR